MAVRATKANVALIITTSATDSQVDAMIASANRIVNGALSGEGLSSALLTDIETWVSAHLLAMTFDRQAQKEKIGDAEETYAKLGEGLNKTTYGQTAIALDTSGMLGNIAKKKSKLTAVESFE